MCRFSKLLLFSFFSCKDGSDRLMKRASYPCCNFLCVVLAATYLKYRRYRLSCLPFVWHFFHCDTHTHARTHTHTHTHARTHARTCARYCTRGSSVIYFAGNSNSSIVLIFQRLDVIPNLWLNTYATVSIVRFCDPIVMVAILSDWLEQWLPSLTLISLSRFSVKLSFWFFFWSFSSCRCRRARKKEMYMFESACELVMLVSVKLRICQCVCESECGRAAFSFVHHLY